MPAVHTYSLLKLLLLGLCVGYLGLMGYAALFTNRQVFPAPPPGYTDSADIIRFAYDETGRSVSMVYLDQPGSRHLIYYHHGNGEDLQSVLPRLRFLQQAGYSVLAWDYPGYGTSDGEPSEGLVFDIAEKIWEAIPHSYPFSHRDVILYGRSLGAGPATWLAAQHESAGLVLEGAFTSIYRVGLPVRLLPWDIFDNIARIGSVRCPVLVIHGTEDQVVPFAHGADLFEKAASPKFFSWIGGGGHSDLIELYPEVYSSSLERFRQFIATR